MTAREQLEISHAENVRAGKPGETLATMMRIGEVGVLAGDGQPAVAFLEDAIAVAGRTEGGTVYLPALRRLHAAALVQTAAVDEAIGELAPALDDAREREDEFETLLLLDLIVRLGHRAGRDVTSESDERESLVRRLGIVALPDVPLTARETVPAP